MTKKTSNNFITFKNNYKDNIIFKSDIEINLKDVVQIISEKDQDYVLKQIGQEFVNAILLTN